MGVRDQPTEPVEPGGASESRTWTADEAVSALYATHWRPMVRLAALLVRDTPTAEEVAQEAFVALHRRWSSLREPQAALGYLRASVVNGARSALRRRSVEVAHRQPAPPQPEGPEERAVRSADHARLLDILRTLPPRQREALVLRYYLDLSEAQIAEAMDVTPGAVKSHVHRGMATLRAQLEEIS